jgi:MarR family transcriptional regulator, organic hydroperoxide resistance regulator
MFSELCQLLQKLTQNHKRIMNTMLEKYDITYPQYLVLITILEKKEVLANEIIGYLDSDKATLSGIIKRLHEREWILKSIDPNDRRKQVLTLSHQGYEKMEAIGSLESDCEAMLSHSFVIKDQKKMGQYLQELIQNQNQYLNESRR